MYGELTDKETVARLEYALEHQQHEQFEILLYKKNSEYHIDFNARILFALFEIVASVVVCRSHNRMVNVK